ncbi:MAG: hypothetical protein HYU66_04225 [Armatimonadetes bacterium]|nr:hypothetical protein [Armatimonadota bacterium]
MVKWEYRVVRCVQVVHKRVDAGGGPVRPSRRGEEVSTIDPEEVERRALTAKEDQLNQLGAEGWELVLLDSRGGNTDL